MRDNYIPLYEFLERKYPHIGSWLHITVCDSIQERLQNVAGLPNIFSFRLGELYVNPELEEIISRYVNPVLSEFWQYGIDKDPIPKEEKIVGIEVICQMLNIRDTGWADEKLMEANSGDIDAIPFKVLDDPVHGVRRGYELDVSIRYLKQALKKEKKSGKKQRRNL